MGHRINIHFKNVSLSHIQQTIALAQTEIEYVFNWKTNLNTHSFSTIYGIYQCAWSATLYNITYRMFISVIHIKNENYLHCIFHYDDKNAKKLWPLQNEMAKQKRRKKNTLIFPFYHFYQHNSICTKSNRKRKEL